MASGETRRASSSVVRRHDRWRSLLRSRPQVRILLGASGPRSFEVAGNMCPARMRAATTRAAVAIAAATAVVAVVGCGGSGGSGSSGGSTSTTGWTRSAQATAPIQSESKLPVATDLTTCVNTLFTHLGAPAEHGGELEPAFVMRSAARHASPALPRLFDEASGGVLSANADQIDFRNSPVELYFFGSARAASDALPAARRELAAAHLGPAASIGASGNVIYVERGSVASNALGAINDCLQEHGGEALPSSAARHK